MNKKVIIMKLKGLRRFTGVLVYTELRDLQDYGSVAFFNPNVKCRQIAEDLVFVKKKKIENCKNGESGELKGADLGSKKVGLLRFEKCFLIK